MLGKIYETIVIGYFALGTLGIIGLNAARDPGYNLFTRVWGTGLALLLFPVWTSMMALSWIVKKLDKRVK